MSLSTTDVLEVLQIYNEVKRRYPNNSNRTCLFLAVCKHIYSDVDVEELSIDCEYGGIIGVGNSCLEHRHLGSRCDTPTKNYPHKPPIGPLMMTARKNECHW